MAIFIIFPGLGELPAARLLAEIGDDFTRFADARGLKAYAGAAWRRPGHTCEWQEAPRAPPQGEKPAPRRRWLLMDLCRFALRRGWKLIVPASPELT